MILSDRDILKKVREGDLKIEPFDESCVQPTTVDLHLSPQVRVFNHLELETLDLKEKKDISHLVKIKPEGFIVHPGEFLLGATTEKFCLPNDLVGRLEGRSSLGRLGLIIHATAGYIDPGFFGWLTFEISNLSRLPIKLYPNMRIAQICFLQVSSQCLRPYGTKGLGSKYQGQQGPTSSRIWLDFEKFR